MRALRRLVLGALLLSSCGEDAALIIVTVSGRPASVGELRVHVTLDGKRTAMPEQVKESLDSFGLLLPPGADGPLLVEADGTEADGCVIVRGRTDTVLRGKSRVRLNLPLTKLTIPDCKRPGR